MDELKDSILTWSRRARLQRSVALSFFGLACGLGVALIIALASRVFPLIDSAPLMLLSLGLALLGLVIALVFPWVREIRTSLLQWARRFDDQFGLKERISTAFEISEGNLSVKSDTVRTLQRRDAGAVLGRVNAKERLPLRISRRDALVALGFVVLLAIAIALPNPQQQILEQRGALRRTIDQQVQQLDQAKEAIEKSTLTDAQKELALNALDEAKRKLDDPNITPEEALAAINEAQSTMDALNDQAAQQQAQDLQRAGESLSPDELTNALANALSNQNFEQAAEQMRNLTNNENGQPLNEEQQQRVADQLDQLARSTQNSDPQLAQQMRDAAQSIREGNTSQAQQSLEQAAQSLQRAQQSASVTQALDEAQARADAARRAIADQAAQNEQAQRDQQRQQQGSTGSESQRGTQTNPDGASQTGSAGERAGSQSGGQPSSSAASGNQSNADGAKSDDFGSADSVYAPSRLNNDGSQVVLQDNQGEIAPNPNGNRSTAPGGNANVPYSEVYSDYAKAADDAMQAGEVPADMRDYVRDYFSSLDPQQSNQPNQTKP
jgi:hypothetical protein